MDTDKIARWRTAVDDFLATNPKPGDIITEEWKQEHFGLPRPRLGTLEAVRSYQLKMLTAFDCFSKELLTEHQIHLKSGGRGAHIVIPPENQTKEAWNDGVNEISRSLRKAKLRLEHVDLGGLDTDHRKENTDAKTRLAMISSMFRKVKKQSI